jgi:hypothetical protein
VLRICASIGFLSTFFFCFFFRTATSSMMDYAAGQQQPSVEALYLEDQYL